MSHDPIVDAHDPAVAARRAMNLSMSTSDVLFLLIPIAYALIHVGVIVAYAHNVFGPTAYPLIVMCSVISILGFVLFGVITAGRWIGYRSTGQNGEALVIAAFHWLLYAGLVVFNLWYFHAGSSMVVAG